MKIKIIIILIITALIGFLIFNGNLKQVQMPQTQPEAPVTDIKQAIKRETKVVPSDIEEAFEVDEYEQNYEMINHDKIAKLQLKSLEVKGSNCGKNYNPPFSLVGEEGKQRFNSCQTNHYFDFDGLRYKCKIDSNGKTILYEDVSSKKVEGQALELLNCNKKGYFVLNGNKYSCPFEPKPIQYEECMKLKGKLGIKECIAPSILLNDYWAGIVKECGGVNNLPTMEELALIASLIFEYTENRPIEAYEDRIVKVLPGLNDYIYLWSNEEFGIAACARSKIFIDTHDSLFKRDSIGLPFRAICKLK